MITVPAEVRVHLALGATDMRKGFDGSSLLAEEMLKDDPFSGQLFIFRGKRAGMIKILFHDDNDTCLSHKRPDRGTLRLAARMLPWQRGRSRSTGCV